MRSQAVQQSSSPAGRSAVGGSADRDQQDAGDDVLTERSSRIAAAHRLLRRMRRVETGEFLAEGAQVVREALGYARDQPGTVHELFVTADAAARHVDLVRAAYAVDADVTVVTDRAMALLSDTQTPQGIVARCRVLDLPVADALRGAPKLVAVLVDTNDPGNAGTIVRLADAAGADAVIFAGDSVDPFNPKVVRASTGSLFHLPVARATREELAAALTAAGLSSLATSGRADMGLPEAIAGGLLELPTAWLFGSEAHGLSEAVMTEADQSVRVPIYGRAESLNLAAAAAICLYASATAQRVQS